MTNDQGGIPRFSRQAIEQRAEAVIRHFAPEVLASPRLTPISAFVKRLVDEQYLRLEVADLGRAGGQKVLGAFAFQPPTIHIDHSVPGTRRYEFVVAHELGHFVLHRGLRIRKQDYADHLIRDLERDLATGRKKLVTPRDWLEWQANQFAASILIPRETLPQALLRIQRELGITRNLGRLVVENNRHSLRDFHASLGGLHRIYSVHEKGLEYRLADLGLLEDRRDDDVRHVSRLFSVAAME